MNKSNNDQKNKDKKINSNLNLGFNQVFAPGVFLIFGITRNKPISLGFGYQFASKLRSFENIENNNVDSHRLFAFVSIDIPLYKF